MKSCVIRVPIAAMTVHRIRLHGFWTATPLDGGYVRHARRFGRPRTLAPGETAWLVLSSGPGAVHLNGEPVGGVTVGGALDVTARLLPRNEVWIDLPSGVTLGDVALELRLPG